MPAQPGDQHHQEILRRLELEDREADARLRKASDDFALARAHKRNAEARILRAQSPPDGRDFCLMCWVGDQRLSYLRHQPDPSPGLTDRWRCEDPNCGHTEYRRRGCAE